ncbi:MAG: hypothetical protein RID81_32920 [Sandaracinaceae bacterium]
MTLTVSRRTVQRFFLLRPDANGEMQNAMWYCAGLAAEEHGIELHAMTGMATHPHYSMSDPHSLAPDFYADFHRNLAAATKGLRDWDEEVFNKSSTAGLEICTPEAFVEDLAYIIANPVAAGVVKRPEDYPGVIVLPKQLGRRRIIARRPNLPYFRSARWPAKVEITLTLPQWVVDHYGSEEAVRREVKVELEGLLSEIHRERAAEGKGYLGAKRAVRISHEVRSTRVEERGRINPLFKVGRGQVALARAKLREIRGWYACYDDCRERWTSGDRNVVWPAGTWWMRVFHRAPCESDLPPET